MSTRIDKPHLRTAEQLERKYNFSTMEKNIKLSETSIVKVNNTLADFINAAIGDLETLKDQLDGQIETWYGSGIPTLSNEPAINWNVSSYPDHVGDVYYDRDSGNAYKFTVEDNVYSWNNLGSSLMSEVLSIANAASDTADSKRRIFTIQPVPPYDVGDIWIKDIGSNTGEIYICQIPRASDDTYVIGDFIIATKYTDDRTALDAQEIAAQARQKAVDLETEQGRLALNFSEHIVLNDGSVEEGKKSKITFDDGAITLSTNESGIKLYMDNDSIEFRKADNTILGSWSAATEKATSTELNLGNFAFIPRKDSSGNFTSLSFRKVK